MDTSFYNVHIYCSVLLLIVSNVPVQLPVVGLLPHRRPLQLLLRPLLREQRRTVGDVSTINYGTASAQSSGATRSKLTNRTQWNCGSPSTFCWAVDVETVNPAFACRLAVCHHWRSAMCSLAYYFPRSQHWWRMTSSKPFGDYQISLQLPIIFWRPFWNRSSTCFHRSWLNCSIARCLQVVFLLDFARRSSHRSWTNQDCTLRMPVRIDQYRTHRCCSSSWSTWLLCLMQCKTARRCWKVLLIWSPLYCHRYYYYCKTWWTVLTYSIIYRPALLQEKSHSQYKHWSLSPGSPHSAAITFHQTHSYHPNYTVSSVFGQYQIILSTVREQLNCVVRWQQVWIRWR